MRRVSSAIRAEPVTADQDPRWQAVITRDPASDGQFVYAVLTTGVYCRPSCPSRLAKAENVGFHLSCEAAERAGFRACKRCRPNEPGRAEAQRALVAEACRTIEAAEVAPALESLARAAHVSPFHFHRMFKAVTGVTPKAYADAHRARRIRTALSEPETSVTNAIYQAGFNSNGRFYASADQELGMTATDFRAGGANVMIRFAVGECSLGSILVASSMRGVCAILLGDDPDALVRDLQDRFPKAELVGGDAGFDHLVAVVVGFVETPGTGLDLPLDIAGTAFQRRVWQALRDIPAGQTASYADVARTVGQPKSVRAVAQACAANALAVAIPCHRVVRSDGALSGYRWGVERKHALLVREGARRGSFAR